MSTIYGFLRVHDDDAGHSLHTALLEAMKIRCSGAINIAMPFDFDGLRFALNRIFFYASIKLYILIFG